MLGGAGVPLMHGPTATPRGGTEPPRAAQQQCPPRSPAAVAWEGPRQGDGSRRGRTPTRANSRPPVASHGTGHRGSAGTYAPDTVTPWTINEEEVVRNLPRWWPKHLLTEEDDWEGWQAIQDSV